MVDIPVPNAAQLVGFYIKEHLFRKIDAKSGKNGTEVMDVLLMETSFVVVEV